MYYRHPRGDKSGQEVVLRRGRWLIRHDLAGHDDEDEEGVVPAS